VIASESGVDVIGTPPAGKINEPYSYRFTPAGPEGTRLMPAGKLPPGLSFNYDTGVLSGTPVAPRPETFSFGIKAYYHAGEDDEWSESVTRYFQLPVEATRNYTQIGLSDTQKTFDLKVSESQTADLWCPAKHPYLINQHLTGGRIVPHGVHVETNIYWQDFQVNAAAHDKDGFQAGVKGMLVSNLSTSPGFITVTLHCTNNQDEAQRA
jgi:hypothetical protein